MRKLASLGNLILGATEMMALCTVTPSPAAAQTNERVYESFEFRTVTPGARAVGTGKTFIGVADDATAAASNPAGLSNLLEREISLEWSGLQVRHQRFVPGAPGSVQTFGDALQFLSFASAVFPAGRTTTVAAFYNALQRHAEAFEIEGRPIPAFGRFTETGFEDGHFGNIHVKAWSAGFSMAQMVSPLVSIGGSVTITKVRLASVARSGAPMDERNGTNTDDSARSVGATFGVLAKPSPRLSVGAAYHKRVTLGMETELVGMFQYTERNTDGTVRLREARPISQIPHFGGAVQAIDYVVPSRYVLGVAWRPANGVSFLADLWRVNYSERITERFLIVDFLDPDARLSRGNYFIPDRVELHTGMEWRLKQRSRTLAFRAGVYTSPDRVMRFRSAGENQLSMAPVQIMTFRFNTLKSNTDLGITSGLGIAFLNRFQVDVAVVLGQVPPEFVLSTVWRFPK